MDVHLNITLRGRRAREIEVVDGPLLKPKQEGKIARLMSSLPSTSATILTVGTTGTAIVRFWVNGHRRDFMIEPNGRSRLYLP